MYPSLVLFYHLDGERGAGIRALCVGQKIRVRTVAHAEYSEPIAALAGLSPLTGSRFSGDAFSDEMLVFCGFSDEQLDRFLKAFRRAGLPPVTLKAVMTPTNASWNSLQLHSELAREHAAISGRS